MQAKRPDKLFTELEKLLLDLHVGIATVESDMADVEHPEFADLQMDEEQHSAVARSIGHAVGADMWSLFEFLGGTKADANDAEKTEAFRVEMLWDDLADIYRDLHHGLKLWEVGTSDAQAEAAWQWRFGFESHWGHHLFRAMLTVHEARYFMHAE